MKFYHVEDLERDYQALVWAESEKEAEKLYREEVTDEEVAPIYEVDVDNVYRGMLEADSRDTEREYAEFGIMGRLHDVIRSTDPMIVMQSGVE